MAFKMNKPSIVEGTRGHRQALKLNREMDKSSLPDGRPKSSAFQMAKKSPIEKELVGKQNNLPEGLKAKIEASPAKMMKKSPTKAVGDKDKKDSKGNISVSAKADKKDMELINKSLSTTKPGGKGTLEEDKKETVKAKRRQEIRDSYKKNRKELKKEAGGSKLKNFFTSKEKLRSKANAKRLRDIKTTSEQSMTTKTKDALGGDDYTGVKEKSPAKLMRKKLKTSGATLINTKGKKRDDTVKKAIEAAKNAKGSPDPYKNKGVYVEPKKKPVPPKKKKLTLQEANRRMS